MMIEEKTHTRADLAHHLGAITLLEIEVSRINLATETNIGLHHLVHLQVHHLALEMPVTIDHLRQDQQGVTPKRRLHQLVLLDRIPLQLRLIHVGEEVASTVHRQPVILPLLQFHPPFEVAHLLHTVPRATDHLISTTHHLIAFRLLLLRPVRHLLNQLPCLHLALELRHIQVVQTLHLLALAAVVIPRVLVIEQHHRRTYTTQRPISRSVHPCLQATAPQRRIHAHSASILPQHRHLAVSPQHSMYHPRTLFRQSPLPHRRPL